jgi:hypothetical protein
MDVDVVIEPQSTSWSKEDVDLCAQLMRALESEGLRAEIDFAQVTVRSHLVGPVEAVDLEVAIRVSGELLRYASDHAFDALVTFLLGLGWARAESARRRTSEKTRRKLHRKTKIEAEAATATLPHVKSVRITAGNREAVLTQGT